jgi:hypothetical protein
MSWTSVMSESVTSRDYTKKKKTTGGSRGRSWEEQLMGGETRGGERKRGEERKAL